MQARRWLLALPVLRLPAAAKVLVPAAAQPVAPERPLEKARAARPIIR